MAGEKLTKVNIRNNNGNVIDTIPISVSVDNIEYDDNTSLEDKINSLQLDSKLDKNLGLDKKGQFLMVNQQGNVISSNLNTTVIKQALKIPTDLKDFDNSTKFVTETDLKDKYSLEYVEQSNDPNNNTILEIKKSVSDLDEAFTKFTTEEFKDFKDNYIEEDYPNITKRISNFQSFMKDIEGYYSLRKEEEDEGHELVYTAKQIIDNTDKISTLEGAVKNIYISTTDENGVITSQSGVLGQLKTNFTNFSNDFIQNDITNKVNKIHYSPSVSYVHFGDSTNVDHMNFWGNSTNRVAMSVTGTDNRRIAMLGRIDGDWKGINLAEYKTVNGVESGSIIYNTQRYLLNEQISIPPATLAAGYISSSTSVVYFYIPLRKAPPKPSSKGKTVYVVPKWTTNTDKKQFSIRTPQGYLNNTQYIDITKFRVTFTPLSQGIHISFEYPTNDIKNQRYVQFSHVNNNNPLTVQVTREFSITFKEK